MENKETQVQQLSTIERDIIRAQIIEVIQSCYDPEIPVNIHELGLIYGVEVDESGSAEVKMTLTTPHCPAAQSLPPEVERKVSTVHGVANAKVTIVWEPPWSPAMMSEAARLELGLL